MVERTYSLPEWNEHGTLRIDRQLSFVALFQEALTKRGVLEECTTIPIFAARAQYILHPRGTFLRAWWLVMIPVIALTAIIVPYQVAFESSALDGMFVAQRVVDFFFLLDMIIQFHAGYFHPDTGRLVTDPTAIRDNYLRTTFAVDLIGMLPYDVFAMLSNGTAAEVRFLRILRVLKLVRLFRLQSLIVNFEMDYNVNHNTLTLWKFVVAVVYLTHCLACGFIFVTVLENADRNWLTEYEYDHASRLTQYTVALYYSAAMVSSVGYGPFGAITPAEQAYAIFCLFVGCMSYAFVITAAINVFINMERDVNEHKRTMNDVNDFLEANPLPVGLQVRVRQYFLQLHRFKVGKQARQEQLLRRMSPELRGLCARHMHEKWFAELPFLTPLDNHMLADVFLSLRLQTYIPRERIFDENDVADCLYIIRRGSVFVKDKLFTVGKCFGEEMILARSTKRGYRAHALQFVETYVLARSDLYDVLDGYPAVIKAVRKGALRMRFRRCIVKVLQKYKKEQDARRILSTFEDPSTPRSKLTPRNSSSTLKRKPSGTRQLLDPTQEIRLDGLNQDLKDASVQDMLRFLMDELADIRRMVREAMHKDAHT